MKRLLKHTAFIMALLLLLSSCSNKGVHMSKHRKSRKCNCPTFVEPVHENGGTAFYG